MKFLLATTAVAGLLALPVSAQTVGVDAGVSGSGEVGAQVGGTDATAQTDAATDADTEIKPKVAQTEADVDVDADAEVKSDVAETDVDADVDADAEVKSDVAATETVAPSATTEQPTVLSAGIKAEELTGARVYDANDEWIGEIHDVVVTEDGKTFAVIDVGGFLGIGEKPVALGLDELLISHEGSAEVAVDSTAVGETDTTAMDTEVEADADTDTAMDTTADPNQPAADMDADAEAEGEMKISVALTKEELEALPEYEG